MTPVDRSDNNPNAPEEMSLEDFIYLPTTISFQSKYNDRFKRFLEKHPYIRMGAVLSKAYAVAYADQKYLLEIIEALGENFTDVHVTGLTLLGAAGLDASGITHVQQYPSVNLKGKGVLLGFVDTGIDYTLPTFQYEDGTSRVAYIWDQTIPGNDPPDMGFGSVFSQERINKALQSPNPYSVVPHRDTEGHGTFLASVAGGRDNAGYRGAAPETEIIAVKLKTLSDYYLGTTSTPPENRNVFGSTDVMMGIEFIINKAEELDRPVAICIALGTNFGTHSGASTMEEYISLVANTRGVVICTAAGNESNARHHTNGVIKEVGDRAEVGIRVDGEVHSLSAYILTEPWDQMDITIQSPAGEMIRNIPLAKNTIFQKMLVLERSLVSITFFQGKKNIGVVIVDNPSSGLWKISLIGKLVISGEYHVWLPITGMISPNVELTQPRPDYTIVNPATAMGSITCGAYNSHNNSLYVSSSWGPTCLPWMSPDFVAPGVNVTGMYPDGPGSMTGTSVAAAITIGASAIMLQWGIVDRNDANMDCSRIRALFIAGCTRDPGRQYPNTSWGYGKLNLLNSFRALWE